MWADAADASAHRSKNEGKPCESNRRVPSCHAFNRILTLCPAFVNSLFKIILNFMLRNGGSEAFRGRAKKGGGTARGEAGQAVLYRGWQAAEIGMKSLGRAVPGDPPPPEGAGGGHPGASGKGRRRGVGEAERCGAGKGRASGAVQRVTGGGNRYEEPRGNSAGGSSAPGGGWRRAPRHVGEKGTVAAEKPVPRLTTPCVCVIIIRNLVFPEIRVFCSICGKKAGAT